MQTIRAGRTLLDGVERAGWWVTVGDDGLVVEVGPEPAAGVERVDLGSCDLLPGLVDLHSDCLEDRARPRPTTVLPLAGAMVQLDTEVVSWGITTHFVCVSLDDSPTGVRTPARAAETVELLHAIGPLVRARHLVHIRFELTSGCIDHAGALCGDDRVRLLSYMDHTPGQGQYVDETELRRYYARDATVTDAALDQVLARRYAARADIGTIRQRVAATARDAGVALASHDDDGVDAVGEAIALGARVCEFPVTAAAARAATTAGLGVVMGAPNALRGRSHLGNLSARDAVAAGTLHALASDYHPPSLLLAIYALADEGACSWAQAVALATSGPAAMLAIEDCGTIAAGKRADLVAVARRAGLPTIVQTWVGGVPAFGADSVACVPTKVRG